MRWALAVLALALAIGFAMVGVNRLATARQAEAAATATVRDAAFVFPVGGAIVAGDAPQAARSLARTIGDVASATGVRLESRAVDAPLAGFVALDIIVTGPESAVRDLARRLENGPVLLRLVVQTMRSTQGGVLLRARAVAPWRR